MLEILHSIKAGLFLLLLAGSNRFLPLSLKTERFWVKCTTPCPPSPYSCVFGHPDRGWKMLHVSKIGIIVLQDC